MILRIIVLAAALTRASAFEDIKCKWLSKKGCKKVSYCEPKGDKCTDAPQAMVTCADADEIPDDARAGAVVSRAPRRRPRPPAPTAPATPRSASVSARSRAKS